ncbi:MAG: hypothetical protein ABIA93_04815 [Candidatus Woesearchaeota archaeon]
MKVWVFIALAVILAPFAHATAIGVNKATLNFEDVLRGGYAEDRVYVSTDSDEPVQASIRVDGNLTDWITFSPDNISISKANGNFFKVIVQPPSDTPNGAYTTILRVGTSSISETTGQYGSAIKTGFRIRVTITVTSEQKLSCSVGGFVVLDAERSYAPEVKFVVSNTGNVRVQPTFDYDIWDKYQEILVATGTFESPAETLPTVTESHMTTIPEQDLDLGQYWIDIKSSPCKNGALMTFNILERGQISDKGDLLRIENPLWVVTGDIIPVTAVFRNRGARTVEATFNGQVLLDDHLVALLESESLNVKPDETINLETFFTPRVPGQYHIKGRVTYNNKLTYEKQSILNVNPSADYVPVNNGTVIKIAIAAVLVVIILALVLLIGKKKKRRF